MKENEWVLETRTCGQCRHFKLTTDIPLCKKKLMSVISTMQVYYNSDEGTCFEQKEREKQMEYEIKYYNAILKKDMPEWNDEDYGLHAIIAKQGKPMKVMIAFIDGVAKNADDCGGGYVIAEPTNEEDFPLFQETVLEWAKEWWCVDDDITEEQLFGENCEDYCDAWFFGLDKRFFESLEEIAKKEDDDHIREKEQKGGKLYDGSEV